MATRRTSSVLTDQYQQSADPASPASNYSILYPRSDGEWYIKNSDGTVKQITNVAGGGGGGMSTVEVTGSTTHTTNISINTSYISSNTAVETFQLPATAAVGDRFEVVGKGTGGWLIAQAAGQKIIFGKQVSATGTSGFLQSNHYSNSVLIECVTANTDFKVIEANGRIQIFL